jgi:3-hydroxyisobutyrate dehydrogenase-like beta-hydroxyacid dehydrogenase
MGGRMARRLLAAGHALHVYDPVVSGIDGATAHTSPAAVAAAVDVVLSSVPMPADVEDVYLGPQGVIQAARPGLVGVDLSTIDPATAQRVATALAAVGVAFLDAPVSGGPSGVEAGTLAVLVGGEAAALEVARPALAAFAGRIVHLGPVGAGSTVKLANQLLVGATTIAVMEAMTLGARAGIDLTTMYEALAASAGDSVMLRRNVPEFLLPRQFAPAFATRLLLKDLRLYVAEAERLGLAADAGRLARDLYEQASAAGLDNQDYAAIVTLIERGQPAGAG